MNKKGMVLIFILAYIFVLILIVTSFVTLTNNEIRTARYGGDSLRAFFLADAGVEKALYELTMDSLYSGESDVSLGEGVYDVNVVAMGDQREITAIGYIPNKTAPRAQRAVSVTAEKSGDPVDITSAFISGGLVDMGGNADILGGLVSGITISDNDNVTMQGNSTVNGNPPVLEAAPPTFEEVFGMSPALLRLLATEYDNPSPNNPNHTAEIAWINGNAKFSHTHWDGEGVIVITGDLEMTGGNFDGLIYVMGAMKMAGNAEVRGALYATNGGELKGGGGPNRVTVEYNKANLDNIAEYYPYEASTWEEI